MQHLRERLISEGLAEVSVDEIIQYIKEYIICEAIHEVQEEAYEEGFQDGYGKGRALWILNTETNKGVIKWY